MKTSKFKYFYNIGTDKCFSKVVSIEQLESGTAFDDLSTNKYDARCEYTGLKDVYGVDVYEGSIITAEFISPEEVYPAIGIVSYCNETFMFVVKDTFGEQDPFSDWVDSGCKVIGNIYQNPELLKG